MFLVYRDMGLGRSLRQVRDQTQYSLSHVEHTSSQHNWRRRVAAWEKHLDHARRQEHEKVVREVAKQHGMASQLMLTLALKKLSEVKNEELTVRDAILMIKTALPMYREGHDSDRMELPPALPDDDPDDDEGEEEDDASAARQPLLLTVPRRPPRPT